MKKNEHNNVIKRNPNELKGLDKVIQGETGEVPLYRSYGTKKKVNPFIIAVNLTMGRALSILLFFFEFVIIAINAVVFFFYGGVLVSTLITVTISSVLISIHTRVRRRRFEFVRKLKKLCKKNGYRLSQKKSFSKSLRWSNDAELDFVLTAGRYTYYVKYATPTKPLSSLTFLSKSEIRYTKHARRNVYTLIFDFKDKSKNLKINFPSYIDEKNKYNKKIILINPKPRDIFVKNEGGAIVPTGSGESIYGYTIFTGTGFLDAVKRNSGKIEEEIKF